MMNIFAASSIISDLNPIHDVAAAAGASASAIGGAVWHAIAAGVSAVMMTAIKGLIYAVMKLITAEIMHTTPQFAHTKFNPVQPAIFSPVWSVMVRVGIAFAVFILVVGVVSSILKGETGTMLKQLVFGLIAVMAMASPIPPIMAQAIFSLIDFFSRYILTAALALSSHAGFFTSTTQSAQVAKDAVAMFSVSNPEYPVIFIVIIGIFAVLAGIAVWLELIAREAIAYLIMGLFPLALAGMFYKGSARWVRRAVEGLLAVALGQIIIAILFAFAVSSLLVGAQSMSITDFGLFTIFMFLASMGLPIAMRVAPMAFEMGEAAFHASSLASTARGHTTDKISPTRHGAMLGGKAASAVSGKLRGTGGSGGSGTTTKANAWNSMTERAAQIGEMSADMQSKGTNPAPTGINPTGTTQAPTTSEPFAPKRNPTRHNPTPKSSPPIGRSGGTPSTPDPSPPSTPKIEPFQPRRNPKRFNPPRDK
jgi:hypothetical protein